MSENLTALQDLPLRDDLRGRSPYGAPMIEVPYALNVNENTHPLPPEVVSAIAEAVTQAAAGLNRYPNRDFPELRRELADFLGHGLDWTQVWAANGSNEILQQILQAFGGPGRTVLSFGPTYSMYPLLASGTNTEFVAGERAADYTLAPQDAAEQVRQHRPAVTLLCSPNNPTGTALEPETIAAVYEAASEFNGIVVVDEAYAEFARDRSRTALNLLPGRQRLIVSRTMSKAFGLAGARLGYLAADSAVVDALMLVRLPYHLSEVTQAVALAALRHRERLLENVEAIREQRDRIVGELTRLGLSPASSDSNFVFFGPVRDSHRLWEGLLADGVLIREFGALDGLRVTAGTEEETTAFLESLRRHLRPGHGTEEPAA